MKIPWLKFNLVSNSNRVHLDNTSMFSSQDNTYVPFYSIFHYKNNQTLNAIQNNFILYQKIVNMNNMDLSVLGSYKYTYDTSYTYNDIFKTLIYSRGRSVALYKRGNILTPILFITTGCIFDTISNKTLLQLVVKNSSIPKVVNDSLKLKCIDSNDVILLLNNELLLTNSDYKTIYKYLKKCVIEEFIKVGVEILFTTEDKMDSYMYTESPIEGVHSLEDMENFKESVLEIYKKPEII